MSQVRVTIREPHESSDDSQDETVGPYSISDIIIYEPDADFKRKPSIIDDDYVLEESDESDSGSSIGSYIFQKDIIQGADFFAELGEIPEIDEISLDLSMEAEKFKSAYSIGLKEAIAKKDMGQFVDPLTGEVITSSEDIVAEQAEESEGEEETYEDSEDWLLEIDIELENTDLLQPKLPDDTDMLEVFLETEEKQVKVDEVVDFDAYEHAECERLIKLTIVEYLDDLIGSVVLQCEYVDPNIILRQHLDKEKLMNEFQEKLAEFDVERRVSSFLNRKIVEHFRRKKTFRPIMEDNPDTVAYDRQKYTDTIYKLDQLLGQEAEIKRVTRTRIDILKSKALQMEQKAKDAVTIFEDLVTKTLVRETFERLGGVVTNQFRKMAALRDEISQIRLRLIQKQHMLAMLMEKMENLENLGNGLCMRDFEHLQTETQALGKKIEERNGELIKWRTRCNADLHIMAHMKEKQQMLRHTILKQEDTLREMFEEKTLCRSRLFELKMNRTKIRKEIHELSFQGGLLDKPALMLDYDDTLDRLIEKRAKIDALKAKHTDMKLKIRAIESKCHSND